MSTPVESDHVPSPSRPSPLEVLVEVVLPSEEEDFAGGPADPEARSRAVLRELFEHAVDNAADVDVEDASARVPLLRDNENDVIPPAATTESGSRSQSQEVQERRGTFLRIALSAAARQEAAAASRNDDDGLPPSPPTMEGVLQLYQEASPGAYAIPEEERAATIARIEAVIAAREEVAAATQRVEVARQDVAAARAAVAATTPTSAPTRTEVQEPTSEPTSGPSSEVQIQPILSSIRDLRSALHQRVLTLGEEVEQLRARAAAVERGFADNRAQRQRVHTQMGDARMMALLAGEGEGEEVTVGDVSFLGEGSGLGQREVDGEQETSGRRQGDRLEVEGSGSWSLSSLVNRVSASQPGVHERNREEGKYEVVKGSGSAEIEGSKEERRQRRMNQVKSESTRLESKASLDALRQRVGRLSTRPSQVNLTSNSDDTTPAASNISTPAPVDRPVLADILSRSRTFAIPPAISPGASPSAAAAVSNDRSLTTRGLRVQNAQNTASTGDRDGASGPIVTAADLNQRYRNALMNRPVPPANTNANTIPSSRPAAIDAMTLTNTFAEEMERNISRLQRMVQDARRLQDRQRASNGATNVETSTPAAANDSTEPSGLVATGEAALERARENVQELRTLHLMLENLYQRFDSAQMGLAGVSRTASTTTARATPSRATPAPAARSRTTPRTQRPVLARRPSPPFLRSSAHPYFRPRIGIEPIAAVLNIDNLNSFELHLDGSVVFRPIARRSLEPELVARCLSMLPGGREDTPSRWMRLIGETTSRPRRAEAWGGYWIRWVSEQLFEVERPRQRRVNTDTLPKVIAYDISVTPPEDDAWVRSDESEFYTARTRLRRHIGPWIHSRIRIAPYDTDPAEAAWGTSAHVRQAIRGLGRVRTGDFARFNLVERAVTLVRAPSAAAPPAPSVSDTTWQDLADVDPSSTAWLNVYEPALQQIADYWQSHHRRVTNGGESPPELLREAEEVAGGWGRDYLDANGVPLPTATLSRLTELTNPTRL